MDYIITTAVLGVFAVLLYRGHKKKKGTSLPDRGAVQTSGSPAGPGGIPALPSGSQVETYVFDFRKYPDPVSLAGEIETKVNRYLIDCQMQERSASVQYIPVGTALVVQCIRTL